MAKFILQTFSHHKTNMASWESLDVDLISRVFQFIPQERGNGRLVCTGWRHNIARAERMRESINLVGKDVSLQRVHQLFPYVKHLEVELPRNTDPYALFLWGSLQTVEIQTSWRLVHGRDIPPTKLAIHTSQIEPETLQLYYKTITPGQEWGGEWCDGYIYGLKGVGARSLAPIVHQAFGVASKPVDWDAHTELVEQCAEPNSILERLPFFTHCCKLACMFYNIINTSQDETIRTWLDAVEDQNAIMLVQSLEEQRLVLRGTKLLKYRTDIPLTVETPPFLPEHPEYDFLISEIEEARIAAFNFRNGRS